MKKRNINTHLKNLLLGIIIICEFTAPLFAPPITTTPVTLLTDTLPNGVPGELRYAINESNANDPNVGASCGNCNQPFTTNHNTIEIEVAGVLTPVANLPTITEPVLIDGTTAPGWMANVNLAQAGPNTSSIVFQINGPGPVFNNTVPLYGLRLGTGSDGSTIQGIAITNFAAINGSFFEGAGIRIDSSNNTILGCFIGADTTGLISTPNFNAIFILGANNIIGDGTAFGRNLIGGQFGNNGTIRNQGTNTLISGNTVNLDKAGTAVLMPDARLGIDCFRSTGSKVIGNVIAGHSGANIIINASNNSLIQHNYIGTDITGTISIAPTGLGIWAAEQINGFPSNYTIDSNTISGNTYGIIIGDNGFLLTPLNGTIIINNFIGTDPTGSFAVPNQFDGVWVKFGQDTYFNNNTISGNGRYGIRLGKSQHSNIKGNWIGTNINGADLGNGADGIYMGGQGVGVMSFGDVIGGAKYIQTSGFLGENNIIQFNGGNGIKTVGYVRNAMIDGNTISNNGLNGIQLGKNASNNVIGSFQNAGNVRLIGDISSQENVANPASALGGGNSIFSNGGDGIRVLSANENIIQDNIITDNPGVGINMVDSSHNLVGAPEAGNNVILPPFLNIPNPLGNIVTGNGGPGVVVDQESGNATDNSILSNQIVDNDGNGIQFVVG